MIDLKTILYPTDFSEYCGKARGYVIEMARKFGAKVVLLHAVPVPTYTGTYEIAIDMSATRELMEQAAKKKIEAEAEIFKAEGIEVRTELRLGTAFVEICETARTENADLIIIATHGWGPVKHLLLGSTAEKVVRKAPCPVLTVRAPEHDFIRP